MSIFRRKVCSGQINEYLSADFRTRDGKYRVYSVSYGPNLAFVTEPPGAPRRSVHIAPADLSAVIELLQAVRERYETRGMA